MHNRNALLSSLHATEKKGVTVESDFVQWEVEHKVFQGIDPD
jgi:hypothetical protein